MISIIISFSHRFACYSSLFLNNCYLCKIYSNARMQQAQVNSVRLTKVKVSLLSFWSAFRSSLWHALDDSLVVEDDDKKSDKTDSFIRAMSMKLKISSAAFQSSFLKKQTEVHNCLSTHITEPIIKLINCLTSLSVTLSQHSCEWVVDEDDYKIAAVASSLSVITSLLSL